MSTIIGLTAMVMLSGALQLPGVPVADNPIYDPQGTETAYIMNVTENTFFGSEQCDGYKMAIRRSDDGKTIWFRDIAPGFNGNGRNEPFAWVEGTVDGNRITVKAGQMIYDHPEFDQQLYLEAVTVDEYGNVTGFLDEFSFTVAGQTISQTDDNIYLAVFEDAPTVEEAGFYIFLNNYVMEPMGEIVSFYPPENVEIEKWVMQYDGGARFVKVARDGDTVYVAGLSDMAPDDFIPGTLSDGSLTFKGGYILCSNPRYYVCLMGGNDGVPDEWGWPTIDMTFEFAFDVDDTLSRMTLKPEYQYIVESNFFKTTCFNAFANVRLSSYDGDTPAVPASPEVIDYDSLNNMLMFQVPLEDSEGGFINSDCLSYSIWFDGEPYEFTPADYIMLEEPMTLIPYHFTDHWDFYFNGQFHTIFLHDTPAWDEVTVVASYTVDGVTHTSTNDPSAGILQAPCGEEADQTFTDMLGRKIDSPAKGIPCLRTVRYSDGTIKTTKIIR